MSESFENVMDYASAVMADCDIPLLDLMKRAHDHELEHIRKVEYHRGFEDGQRSMDAEHRAVAMRLRGLRFDGGSHENLNKIAYAIYPCATGWTVESCEGLRDKIIELLGGVHDGVSNYVPGRACGDDRDNRDGQQEAVDYSAAAQVMYDVLGNERHKAVCELRKVRTELDESVWTWIEDVAVAIGAQDKHIDEYESMLHKITCRLIHLLGGDEPTAMDYIKRIVSEHDKKLSDMELSGAELSQASVDAMSGRAKSCKGGETIKSVGECDGKIMESGENHQIEATITNELRERIAAVCKVSGLSGEKLYGIADRIDEQFERICEQHEAVLQHTIDDMVDERDELQAKLEEADAAIANYREREKSFVESERLRENLTHDVEMWRKRAEYMRALYDDVQAKLDVIWEAVDE